VGDLARPRVPDARLCRREWRAAPRGIGTCLLAAISLSIIITWVFNHTRASVFIAILLHTCPGRFGHPGISRSTLVDMVQPAEDRDRADGPDPLTLGRVLAVYSIRVSF
jgi:hypothetical protein